MILGSEWSHWRGEIAKACDGTHQTIEGVEAEIRAGRQAPLYADGCCFVVSIENYPGARTCQVWWTAGDMEHVLAAADGLHAWAKSQGCTEMLIEGNPAWQRVLKPLGYSVFSVTIRRPLDGLVH